MEKHSTTMPKRYRPTITEPFVFDAENPLPSLVALSLQNLKVNFEKDLFSLTVLDFYAGEFYVPCNLDELWKHAHGLTDIANYLVQCGRGSQVEGFEEWLGEMQQTLDSHLVRLRNVIVNAWNRPDIKDRESFRGFLEHMSADMGMKEVKLKEMKEKNKDEDGMDMRDMEIIRKIVHIGIEVAEKGLPEGFRIDLLEKKIETAESEEEEEQWDPREHDYFGDMNSEESDKDFTACDADSCVYCGHCSY